MIRMEDAGGFKRKMFHNFMTFARGVGPDILDGKPVSLGKRLKYALGNLLVYGPLKNTLACRGCVSAIPQARRLALKSLTSTGRSDQPETALRSTEASVFITQQPDGEVRSDTVGVASPGVELKIADSGEVFYRSPGTFVEYYKNAESTKSTKDAEDNVTGDAGFIEKDTGHLRIIDRAKDVGKMKDGSLFAPKYVENKLKFYPNILNLRSR